jgi:hypothetical protein
MEQHFNEIFPDRKKGKNLVKYHLFFDRAGKNLAVKQCHTSKSQPFFPGAR